MRNTLHFNSFAACPRTMRKMLRRAGYDETTAAVHIVFQPNENRAKENKTYDGYVTEYDAISQMWIHLRFNVPTAVEAVERRVAS